SFSMLVGCQFEDTEPDWRAVVAIAILGSVARAGLIVLARKDPSLLPPHTLRAAPVQERPASWAGAAGPWIVGALALLGSFALLDRHGLMLGWDDFEYHLAPLG